MSNYTRGVNFSGLAQSGSAVDGDDFDTEFDAMAVSSATKANEVGAPTVGNIVTLSATGDLQDSEVAVVGTRRVMLAAPELITNKASPPVVATWTKETIATLSSANATAGIFKVRVITTAAAADFNVEFHMRKFGSSAGGNVTRVLSQNTDTTLGTGSWSSIIQSVIPCSDDGEIEWKLVTSSAPTMSQLTTMYLEGYYF